ncbi:SPASM domain-containing protein [Shigella sonnei]
MHVTAKPSSFQCNLKCDYCFYLEKESQFTHEKWMDDSTLKEFIKQYIAASGNQVYFTWQGGEPTLAGLDFFRKVIHYQQRYAGQKRIFNALQTNGILLNNEWCAFLKEHEFLVGISIDGPQELHDRYRRSNSGNGTCIFQESCKDNLVVESNGDIYECDHFVYPQYKIGNINKSELKTMNSVQLTAQKKRISAKCQQCAYKPICNGGCPKHRITKVNNETVSYFCEGYKILFSTMVPYMNAMVELAKNRVPLYHIMDVAKQMENN